jgi:hypothetical protein
MLGCCACVALVVSACGDKISSGGDAPPSAPVARRGTLLDANLEPVAGAPIRIITVDDGGSELDVLGITATDTTGQFEIGPTLSHAPNASLWVTGTASNQALRAFLAGDGTGIPISPLTDALASLVLDITRPQGGRRLGDFDTQELRSLTAALASADSSGADLNQVEDARAVVRASLGRAIAEASGGGITVQSSESFLIAPNQGDPNGAMSAPESVMFAPNTTVCPLGPAITTESLGDADLHIEEDGTLCGATKGSLDSLVSEGALQLVLTGSTFLGVGGDAFPNASASLASRTAGVGIRLGPFDLEDPNQTEGQPPRSWNVDVQRTIYPVEGTEVLRVLEVLTNTNAFPVNLVDVTVRSFLETGNESSLLVADNPVGGIVDAPPTRYAVAYDPFEARSTTGFIWHDALGPVAPDEIFVPGLAGGAPNEVSFSWRSISLDAGEQVAFVHYAVVSASQDAEAMRDVLETVLFEPPMSGLTLQELRAIVNFAPTRGTLVGEPGAVIGGALVTATNLTTSAPPEIVTARSDGAFAVPLETAIGDLVRIEATDGLAVEYVVP